MNLDAFRATLGDVAAPEGVSGPVKALWLVAKDDWDGAHKVAQDADDADGAWVHAHLHRVEGDLRNAGYWYDRAGKPECTTDLETEWAEIAAALLSKD